MKDSDQAIVRAVNAGNTDAFAQLVDHHKQEVFAILVRLTGDRGEAQELAHETFVRAFRGLKGFKGEARFGTWVVQIAIHLARDRVRARRRSRMVSLDDLIEREGDSLAFTETRVEYDPMAGLETRDVAQEIERALDELPAEYREVFVLHHVHEIPYGTIAEMTGDSVGSLKVRSHRARKLLRERLFSGASRLSPEDVAE